MRSRRWREHPLTPWGEPDLRGYWLSLSYTPLERPAEFADKPLLTPQEAIEFFHEFPWMCDPDLALAAVSEDGRPGRVVRIPLRLSPGQPLPFSPDDVILHSGDILFIQSRDAELFYTGGLLPPGCSQPVTWHLTQS